MKSALPFAGRRRRCACCAARRSPRTRSRTVRPGRRARCAELFDRAEYREERYAALAVAGHRRYRDHRDPAALALYRDP